MEYQTILVLLLILLVVSPATANHSKTSILFSSVGRSSYDFDIYTLPLHHPPPSTNSELRLTDGTSVNFNGHFPSTSPPNQLHLIYVSERTGSSTIYLDTISFSYPTPSHTGKKPLTRTRTRKPLLVGDDDGIISMKDRPSLAGDYLVHVSTHQDPGRARSSWAAVYSTNLKTGSTRRLTPKGVADFSPATSPLGKWTAVASFGDKGWGGEIEELDTGIYVFRIEDGSGRVRIAERGGWPSWADESTIYFHRKSEEDGWWSVYCAYLTMSDGETKVVTRRVTPPGIHAFTPAASVANKSFIVVATRRPGSEFRHIEMYDLVSRKFIEVTRPVSPRSNHYNPFVSPDSTRVGYHRCGAKENGRKYNRLLLENFKTATPEISLFRVDGSFPSFQLSGDRIAYVNLAPSDGLGLFVINRDGSGLRRIIEGSVVSTTWDLKRDGILYASVGPSNAPESAKVDIISINIDKDISNHKNLTIGEQNNAFPYPSPDGKKLVFRSSRSGFKNLYIMDTVEGEKGGLQRVTEGPWTDTMCNWSPNGDWIAFASDRENPGTGSFDIYMIHPNGTGLRTLVKGGPDGVATHPYFSPDGNTLAFTSDYAAVSAEPISNPQHFRPYGEIFTIELDGSGMKRLTHNSYEDGAPIWVPKFLEPIDVPGPNSSPCCSFDDCLWLSSSPNHSTVATAKIPCVR